MRKNKWKLQPFYTIMSIREEDSMQIRNDYTSFQNRNYQEGHTHHITECLQEDPVKQKEGDTYLMSIDARTAQPKTEKPGRGILKNFWDSLGEETSDKKENALSLWRDHLLSGIHGAAASIRESFQYQVVERVQSVPSKVKAVLQSAGVRFRRGKDGFTALTGGQNSPDKNNSGREKRKEGQISSPGKEDDIPMKMLKHSHLMDSYSRRGEYCQLNDNLTYGKNSSGRNRTK